MSVIFARDFFFPHSTSNNSCRSKCFALPVPDFVASLNTFCIAVLSHLVSDVASVVFPKSSTPSHFIFIPFSHGTFLIALNTELRASVEDTFGSVSATCPNLLPAFNLAVSSCFNFWVIGLPTISIGLVQRGFVSNSFIAFSNCFACGLIFFITFGSCVASAISTPSLTAVCATLDGSFAIASCVAF